MTAPPIFCINILIVISFIGRSARYIADTRERRPAIFMLPLPPPQKGFTLSAASARAASLISYVLRSQLMSRRAGALFEEARSRLLPACLSGAGSCWPTSRQPSLPGAAQLAAWNAMPREDSKASHMPALADIAAQFRQPPLRVILYSARFIFVAPTAEYLATRALLFSGFGIYSQSDFQLVFPIERCSASRTRHYRSVFMLHAYMFAAEVEPVYRHATGFFRCRQRWAPIRWLRDKVLGYYFDEHDGIYRARASAAR